jgi:NitT/TauT family transport system permease protein
MENIITQEVPLTKPEKESVKLHFDPIIKCKSLLKDIFFPFGKINKTTKSILLVSQLFLIGILMQIFHSELIPAPLDILKTIFGFLSSSSFYDDFFATFMFVMKGMGYAMFLTMLFTYIRPIAFFTPFVDFVSKCRYITFSTVIILFTMMVKGGNLSDLKMLLLLFGAVPFFVNSFVEETAIGQGTPEYHLDKAYVNKLNKWEALWEVIIVGKLDRLFLVVRANFAIAWAIVTTVESNAMNEGGIGTMISKSNKHMLVGELMAIALLVLLLGVFFDYIYGVLRWSLFAYTRNNKQ